MPEKPSDTSQRPPPDPPSAYQQETDLLTTIRDTYVAITGMDQVDEPLPAVIMRSAELTTKHKLASFSKGQANCVVLVQNLARAFDAMDINADVRRILWSLPTMRTQTWPRLVARTITGMIGEANKPASCPQPGTVWDLMTRQLREWDNMEDPDEDEPRIPPSTTPFSIKHEQGTDLGVIWNQRDKDRTPAKAMVVKTREGTHELVMSPFIGLVQDRDLSTVIFYNQARTPLLHRIWFLLWTDLLPIHDDPPSVWESQWPINQATLQTIDLRRARKSHRDPARRVLPGFSPTTSRGHPRREDPEVQRIQANVTPPRQPNDQVRDHQVSSNTPKASQRTPVVPTPSTTNPPLIAVMIDVEGMGLYLDSPNGPASTPLKCTAVSEFAATISIPEQSKVVGYIHGLISEDYPLAVFDQACYNTASITGLPPLTFKRADGKPLITPNLAFPSVRDCTDALVELVERYEALGHQVVLLAQDDKMERDVLTNPQYVGDQHFLAERLTDIAQIKPSHITDRWKGAIKRIKNAKTDQAHDYIKNHQNQAAAKPCCPHHKRVNPSYHCALADTLLYTGLIIDAMDEFYKDEDHVSLEHLAATMTQTTARMQETRDLLHQGVLMVRGITPPSKLEQLYETGAIRTGVTDYNQYELPPGTTIRSYVRDAVLVMRDGSLTTLRERAAVACPDKTVPSLGLIGTTSAPLPNTTLYNREDQLSIQDLLNLFPHDSDLIGGVNRENRNQAFQRIVDKYPWLVTRRLSAANVGYPHEGNPFPLFAQTVPPIWGVAERDSPRDDYRNNMNQTRVNYQFNRLVEHTFTPEIPTLLTRPRMRLWNHPVPSDRGALLKRWTNTIDRYDGTPPPSYDVPRNFIEELSDARAHRERLAGPNTRGTNWTPRPSQEANSHPGRPHTGWSSPEDNSPPGGTQRPTNNGPQAPQPIQWGRLQGLQPTPLATQPPNQTQTSISIPTGTNAPTKPEVTPTPAARQEITALKREIEELRRAREQEATKADQTMAQLRAGATASNAANAQAFASLQQVLTSLAKEVSRTSEDKQKITEKNARLLMETSTLRQSVTDLQQDLANARRQAKHLSEAEKELQAAKQELEEELNRLRTKARSVQPTKRQTPMPTDDEPQQEPVNETIDTLAQTTTPDAESGKFSGASDTPAAPTPPRPDHTTTATDPTAQANAVLQLIQRLSQDPAVARAILDSEHNH